MLCRILDILESGESSQEEVRTPSTPPPTPPLITHPTPYYPPHPLLPAPPLITHPTPYYPPHPYYFHDGISQGNTIKKTIALEFT